MRPSWEPRFRWLWLCSLFLSQSQKYDLDPRDYLSHIYWTKLFIPTYRNPTEPLPSLFRSYSLYVAMLSALLIARLTLRACILCVDLKTLFLLHRQHVCQNLVSGLHRSTLRRISHHGSTAIIILKLGLDATVLTIFILMIRTFDVKFEETVAEKVSLARARINVAINICVRFSMTCATALEVSA